MKSGKQVMGLINGPSSSLSLHPFSWLLRIGSFVFSVFLHERKKSEKWKKVILIEREVETWSLKQGQSYLIHVWFFANLFVKCFDIFHYCKLQYFSCFSIYWAMLIPKMMETLAGNRNEFHVGKLIYIVWPW